MSLTHSYATKWPQEKVSLRTAEVLLSTGQLPCSKSILRGKQSQKEGQSQNHSARDSFIPMKTVCITQGKGTKKNYLSSYCTTGLNVFYHWCFRMACALFWNMFSNGLCIVLEYVFEWPVHCFGICFRMACALFWNMFSNGLCIVLEYVFEWPVHCFGICFRMACALFWNMFSNGLCIVLEYVFEWPVHCFGICFRMACALFWNMFSNGLCIVLEYVFEWPVHCFGICFWMACALH